jgi:hypothetical protein
MKRKKQPSKRRPPKVVVDEADQAGLDRFVRLAFRRAVEKTGKVVVIGMERRR